MTDLWHLQFYHVSCAMPNKSISPQSVWCCNVIVDNFIAAFWKPTRKKHTNRNPKDSKSIDGLFKQRKTENSQFKWITYNHSKILHLINAKVHTSLFSIAVFNTELDTCGTYDYFTFNIHDSHVARTLQIDVILILFFFYCFFSLLPSCGRTHVFHLFILI